MIDPGIAGRLESQGPTTCLPIVCCTKMIKACDMNIVLMLFIIDLINILNVLQLLCFSLHVYFYMIYVNIKKLFCLL